MLLDKLKRLGNVFVVLMLILVFTFALNAGYNAKAKQFVNVGIVDYNPPFEINENGKLMGFDVAILNAIAKRENFKIHWHKLNLGGLIKVFKKGIISRDHFNLLIFSYITQLLKKHDIDIAASGIEITSQRTKVVSFSTPYCYSGVSILVKKESHIKNWMNLKDKKVAVKIGGTLTYALASKIHNIKLKGFTTFKEIYNQLQNDKVQAVIANNIDNLEYAKNHNDVKVVGRLINVNYYAIAIAKQNIKLIRLINEGLEEIIKDGYYHKICKKYFTLKCVSYNINN